MQLNSTLGESETTFKYLTSRATLLQSVVLNLSQPSPGPQWRHRPYKPQFQEWNQ